ncbi:MAG: hypothetical protein M3347_01845, partial [Armatimonadota bacterium]|nr:hypothetical protein [Armatimonadota bacterium]
MHRVMKSIAGGALLWALALNVNVAPLLAADANTARFLPNADFAEGKDAPAGWKLNKEATNLRLVRDTVDFKGDPAALRVETTGPAKGDVMTDLWKAVPPGTFTLSGYAKASGHWKQAQLAVQSLKEGWGGADWIVVHDIKPSNDWQPFSKSITFSKDAKFALIHLIVEGEGMLHIDELKIETADAPAFDPAAEKKPIRTTPVRFAGQNLYNWKQVFIGAGGTPTVFAQHPKDPGVIYCGMDVGGPMRRDVQNNRWIPLADVWGPNNISLYHTENIALDANDPDVVYYSAGKEWQSGQPSILKSTNRGATWTQVALKNREGKDVFITNGRTGKRLAVDPHNSQTLFYGSRKDGLFKSSDAGKSWQQITSFPVGHPLGGQSPDGMSISFVLFDPNSRTIYVQAGMPKDTKASSGVYRSDDSGATWKKLDAGPSGGVGELDAQGTLYVAGSGIWRYKNGAWQEITPQKNKSYSAVAISPADPQLIAVAQSNCGWGNAIFRSTDGGATWTEYNDNDFQERGKKTSVAELQPWEGGNSGAHAYACVSSLTFDRADPKKLWMTSWPGVWSCRDFTADVLHWRAEVEGHE